MCVVNVIALEDARLVFVTADVGGGCGDFTARWTVASPRTPAMDAMETIRAVFERESSSLCRARTSAVTACDAPKLP